MEYVKRLGCEAKECHSDGCPLRILFVYADQLEGNVTRYQNGFRTQTATISCNPQEGEVKVAGRDEGFAREYACTLVATGLTPP